MSDETTPVHDENDETENDFDLDELTPEEKEQLKQKRREHNKTVRQLREKHGRRIVHFFDEDEGTIAYRRPKRGAMKRFTRDGNDDNMDTHVVMETLLKSCVIHPTPAKLDEIFEVLPGHASEASRAVLELGRTTGRGNRGK